MSDTLADMITRIRNGQKANKVSVKAIFSNLNVNVCNVLKKALMNKELPFEERVKIQMKLDSMPRNSSRIRFRNRCFLSGRPRGVYSKFNLSRIAIRDMAGKGQIPGLTKASW